MDRYLRIGQVAEIAAIDIDVLRTMVRREQITPTIQNGWAKFDHVDAYRIYLISCVASFGVPLVAGAKMLESASVRFMLAQVIEAGTAADKVLVRGANMGLNPAGTIAEWNTSVMDRKSVAAGMGMVTMALDLERTFDHFRGRLALVLSNNADSAAAED